jgi:hypothetical protein
MWKENRSNKKIQPRGERGKEKRENLEKRTRRMKKVDRDRGIKRKSKRKKKEGRSDHDKAGERGRRATGKRRDDNEEGKKGEREEGRQKRKEKERRNPNKTPSCISPGPVAHTLIHHFLSEMSSLNSKDVLGLVLGLIFTKDRKQRGYIILI